MMVTSSAAADFSISLGVLGEKLVDDFTITLLGEDLSSLILTQFLVT